MSRIADSISNFISGWRCPYRPPPLCRNPPNPPAGSSNHKPRDPCSGRTMNTNVSRCRNPYSSVLSAGITLAGDDLSARISFYWRESGVDLCASEQLMHSSDVECAPHILFAFQRFRGSTTLRLPFICQSNNQTKYHIIARNFKLFASIICSVYHRVKLNVFY